MIKNKENGEKDLDKILEDVDFFLSICDWELHQNNCEALEIHPRKLKNHHSVSDFLEKSKKLKIM